ncbi:MAG TPA: molybdopterin molybdenumtransferase MoeA [Moorella mulderi]|nr:molybdopterin molybdenumtransferase MoeA [Moorella mulderi]
MDFFKVIPLEEARKLLLDRWKEIERRKEILGLNECLGREMAAAAVAAEPLPAFPRAVMDGFAIRAADTFGAQGDNPALLEIKGEVRPGEEPGITLTPGTAIAVSTGSMMPEGADAVVMVEEAEVEAGKLAVFRPIPPGENVVSPGVEVKPGEVLLPEGTIIRPGHMGLLAAAGVTQVSVYEPWRLGIIVTGNEVVPPSAKPAPGQVRDVHSYTLSSMIREGGGIPCTYGITPDELESITQRAQRALEENHGVLITGGSSVGTRDLTLQVLSHLGAEILFHGLAIRPGKPTAAAWTGEKLILALPGNPVSAMVVYKQLLDPLLRYGSYEHPGQGARVKALLAQTVFSPPGRLDFIRVVLTRNSDCCVAHPIPGGSGLISTMARAHGLLPVPLGIERVEEGSWVEVELL